MNQTGGATLRGITWPIGATVSAYAREPSGQGRGAPLGKALETVPVTANRWGWSSPTPPDQPWPEGSITESQVRFTSLILGRRYTAAALIGGEWRRVGFIADEPAG